MILLGIETSCDETSAAVITTSSDNSCIQLLSNVISTSMNLHAKTGGIIPEIAARNQIQYIIPVIDEALRMSKKNSNDIDAIAVTYGPGLIGSLLVGVETAKSLSLVWKKPIIPVNHLFGHFYANWIATQDMLASQIQFPAIGLIVSGGHTDLILMKNHKDISWLGGTRDDAAGEAFDKIGRMMGLAYPAGPAIEQLAKRGNPNAIKLPRPIMYDKSYDFSFSGLKTAAMREIQKHQTLDETTTANIARAIQDAISDVLVYKTLQAAQRYNVKSIILGGGVSANQTLRQTFIDNLKNKIPDVLFFAPPKILCTDNAAMIAAAAVYRPEYANSLELTANPELYFD